MFDENARGALIQHLGYVPEEEKEVEAVQEAVVSEDVPVEEEKEITAEDLFATPSPMEQPAVKPIEEETKEEEKEEKEETKKEEKVEVDTPEFSEAIKRCVVVGDFARAVDLCFAQGRFADALMIAMWGGDELLEQARVPSALSPHP